MLTQGARCTPRCFCLPALILAGCATTTASAGTDAVACSAFEPIRWSKKDTEETVRQAKAHNATLVAICGPSPNKK